MFPGALQKTDLTYKLWEKKKVTVAISVWELEGMLHIPVHPCMYTHIPTHTSWLQLQSWYHFYLPINQVPALQPKSWFQAWGSLGVNHLLLCKEWLFHFLYVKTCILRKVISGCVYFWVFHQYTPRKGSYFTIKQFSWIEINNGESHLHFKI